MPAFSAHAIGFVARPPGGVWSEGIQDTDLVVVPKGGGLAPGV